jgi:hypothetical protein
MAALGLVHVMCRDQHREAFRRKRVDLVPEIASRLGVHACGRLIQEQKIRVWQRAGAECQALLPATGELTRELFLATVEA